MCNVDWCEETGVTRKGFCNRHYLQMKRHGKILPIKRNVYSPQEFVFEEDICKILLHTSQGDFIDFAIIDKDDFKIVQPYKFNYQGRRYVRSNSKGENRLLHQLIMGGKWIDHIDGNSLNNRRNNLRFCNNQQNQFNQKPRSNTFSKYKGVSIIRNRKKLFRASIYFNGKSIYLGSFSSEIEAAIAYNKAAKEKFGEFAKLNVI